MKINSSQTQIIQPVPVTGTGNKNPPPNTGSALYSPYAPSWPEVFQKFLEKLENLFYFLFSWILPKKPEKKDQPTKQNERILQTIYKGEVEKKNNQFNFDRDVKTPLKENAKQAFLPCAFSWYQGSHSAVSAFVAKKAMDVTIQALEYVAKKTPLFYYPTGVKNMSLCIAAPVVWIAADRLGYPQSYLFFFGVIMSLFQLNKDRLPFMKANI